MPLFQIAAGLAYANMAEWAVHKFLLHDVGKNKDSFWSYHWHEHHRNCRKFGNYDETYLEPPTHPSRAKEFLGILGMVAVHLPLLPIAPWFVGTLTVYAGTYLWAHRKSHLDVEWGRKWLPWHWDHHRGRDQDKNWGVLAPWFDWLTGTRVKYDYDEKGRPKSK